MILSITRNDGTKELIAGRMISSYPNVVIVYPYDLCQPAIRIEHDELRYGTTTYGVDTVDYRHGGEVLRPER